MAALRSRPGIESAESATCPCSGSRSIPTTGSRCGCSASRISTSRHGIACQRERQQGSRTRYHVMERDGQLISNLDIGSRARVRAGSRVLEVPISGISFDPAQAPATQDHFIYAYVDKPTYTSITGEAANQRLLLRFNDVTSKKEVQAELTISLPISRRRHPRHLGKRPQVQRTSAPVATRYAAVPARQHRPAGILMGPCWFHNSWPPSWPNRCARSAYSRPSALRGGRCCPSTWPWC